MKVKINLASCSIRYSTVPTKRIRNPVTVLKYFGFVCANEIEYQKMLFIRIKVFCSQKERDQSICTFFAVSKGGPGPLAPPPWIRLCITVAHDNSRHFLSTVINTGYYMIKTNQWMTTFLHSIELTRKKYKLMLYYRERVYIELHGWQN